MGDLSGSYWELAGALTGQDGAEFDQLIKCLRKYF